MSECECGWFVCVGGMCVWGGGEHVGAASGRVRVGVCGGWGIVNDWVVEIFDGNVSPLA